MKKARYLCAGIMTGNSLDAVDSVLTAFENDRITDICGHSRAIPANVASGFRRLKSRLAENGGDIDALCDDEFVRLHDEYVLLVAQTVREMLAANGINPTEVDAIGFHGQTCYHFPPSQATDGKTPNTLQIGSGQMLSNLLDIPVVYDFRSDDIMNGGEGAPLAPAHNMHLAADLRRKGCYPAVFCNGGNTGNIAAVFENRVVGWDCGPFNHFVDALVREKTGESCDFDGKYGKKGRVDFEFLELLFMQSAILRDGNNFLLLNPPKSGDPAWYQMPQSPLDFVDKVRTAEFFSAYIMVFGLQFLPIKTPDYFLLFGGGWNNPLIRSDFENLLRGQAEVLPQHKDIFAQVSNPDAVIDWSDNFGYNGKYMEARIFADMAKCFLTREPFSFPDTTGCKTPTVGGIMAVPQGNDRRLWSRAAKGWNEKSTQ